MTDRTGYPALIALMKAEQVRLLDEAARAGQIPTSNALARIADLEVAIGAAEEVSAEALESATPQDQPRAR